MPEDTESTNNMAGQGTKRPITSSGYDSMIVSLPHKKRMREAPKGTMKDLVTLLPPQFERMHIDVNEVRKLGQLALMSDSEEDPSDAALDFFPVGNVDGDTADADADADAASDASSTTSAGSENRDKDSNHGGVVFQDFHRSGRARAHAAVAAFGSTLIDDDLDGGIQLLEHEQGPGEPTHEPEAIVEERSILIVDKESDSLNESGDRVSSDSQHAGADSASTIDRHTWVNQLADSIASSVAVSNAETSSASATLQHVPETSEPQMVRDALSMQTSRLLTEVQDVPVNRDTLQATDDDKEKGFDGETWERVSANEGQEHNGAYRKWYKLWRR